MTSKGAGGGDTQDNLMPLCREHHVLRHQKGMLYLARRFPTYCHWLLQHNRFDVFVKLEEAHLALERELSDAETDRPDR